MKTAVIIPTYNQEEFTIKCFRSISENAPEAVLYWVDNGSSPESRSKVEKYVAENKINCVETKFDDNKGFVKGVNAGLKKALEDGADYFVIQNNDTEVYSGWLSTMVKALEADKKIGMVGPLSNSSAWQTPDHLGQFVSELKDIPMYAGKPVEYAEKVRKLYEEKYFTSDKIRMLSFFSTVIKKEVIEKVGFLSEDFGVGYGDDDDYGARLLEAGYKIAITPGVFVFHNHKTTFKSIYNDEEIKKMQAENLEVYRQKHGLYGRKAAYKQKIKKILKFK
jgi:GT2 family glycosyltransferase